MRILVATDGSVDASNAIEWLMHFPLPADADVDVVTVAPRPISNETSSTALWLVPAPASAMRMFSTCRSAVGSSEAGGGGGLMRGASSIAGRGCRASHRPAG